MAQITFQTTFALPERERQSGFSPDVDLQRRNPIHLAQEWQYRIGNSDVPSQAALALNLGISRARVTQVLNLLRLDRDVQTIVKALGDPLSTPRVTERMLRPLLDLAPHQQKDRLEKILSRKRPMDDVKDST